MKVIHLHIPKTAGGTVRSIMKLQYSNGLCMIPTRGWQRVQDSKINAATAITGHFPHSALNRWGIKETDFTFTFLRDPLERIGSMYAYIYQRGRAHAAYRYVSMYTPQEFAEQGPFDNGMTRQLAGMKGFQWFHEKRELTQEDLETAIQNMGKLDLVGDVAVFRDYMHYLEAELDWTPFVLPHINASISKPRIKLTHEVAKKWAWDIELYRRYTAWEWGDD